MLDPRHIARLTDIHVFVSWSGTAACHNLHLSLDNIVFWPFEIGTNTVLLHMTLMSIRLYSCMVKEYYCRWRQFCETSCQGNVRVVY